MKIKSGNYWFKEKNISVLERNPRTKKWMNGSLINNPKLLFHEHLKKCTKNYLSFLVNTQWKERFVAKKFFSSLKWFLFYGKTNHTWNRLICFPSLSDIQFIYFYSLSLFTVTDFTLTHIHCRRLFFNFWLAGSRKRFKMREKKNCRVRGYTTMIIDILASIAHALY